MNICNLITTYEIIDPQTNHYHKNEHGNYKFSAPKYVLFLFGIINEKINNGINISQFFQSIHTARIFVEILKTYSHKSIKNVCNVARGISIGPGFY